jgi:hypothetical protein
MSGPGVAVNAAVFTASVGVDAGIEANIGAVILSDDRFGSIAQVLSVGLFALAYLSN